MNCAIIACEMLEHELAKPLKNWKGPVVWLDRGLHEFPQKLRDAVQEAIDQLPPEIDTVALAFGFCGGAMEGVSSPTRRLVLPLCDDCITMLLDEPRSGHAMYYTDAWFDHEKFLTREYDAFAEKMGDDVAQEIYREMLKGYDEFCLMDTGAYDMAAAQPAMDRLYKIFNLPWRAAKATTSIVEDLVNKNWDSPNFWVLKPGESYSLSEFMLIKNT